MSCHLPPTPPPPSEGTGASTSKLRRASRLLGCNLTALGLVDATAADGAADAPVAVATESRAVLDGMLRAAQRDSVVGGAGHGKVRASDETTQQVRPFRK